MLPAPPFPQFSEREPWGSAAKSKSPPDLLLPARGADLSELEEQADWERYLSATLAQSQLAKDLHEKLLASAQNELLDREFESSLSLKRVAEFLAWISNSKKQALGWAVEAGLKGLGIAHLAARPGRPKGRNLDILYLRYVKRAQLCIEQTGVFHRRREMKAKIGRKWSTPFRSLLDCEGWHSADIDLLTTSRGPRSFAIHKAAEYFDVSYDAIDRACRRAAKAAKK